MRRRRLQSDCWRDSVSEHLQAASRIVYQPASDGAAEGEAGLGVTRIDGARHDPAPRGFVGGGGKPIRFGGKEIGENGRCRSRDDRMLARIRGSARNGHLGDEPRVQLAGGSRR